MGLQYDLVPWKAAPLLIPLEALNVAPNNPMLFHIFLSILAAQTSSKVSQLTAEEGQVTKPSQNFEQFTTVITYRAGSYKLLAQGCS